MNDSTNLPPGTLKLGEPHPSAQSALDYVRSLPFPKLMLLQGALSSCALAEMRFAEVCSETLRRVLAGEPVSDRYVLGLAWATRGIVEMSLSEPSMSFAAEATEEEDKFKAPSDGASLARVEEQLRIALDGHRDSEVWGEEGLLAATMRCADDCFRTEDLMHMLNDYIAIGGMLSEPTFVDDQWEMGRNLGHSYCIDGRGNTLLECLQSVSQEVWDEISQLRDAKGGNA